MTREVNATEAARNLGCLLDAVEHRGEHFTIVRRGKPIAHLEPAGPGLGAENWGDELATIRGLVEIESRS